MAESHDFSSLVADILACRHCVEALPCGVRPILQVNPKARILIASQAPGLKAHTSGIPFQDASGVRLRQWMGIGEDVFYDSAKIAIVPMGFCYPGKGASGDLPPRQECRHRWHASLLPALTNIRLRLLIGQYAQQYHLGARRKSSLTETVRAYEEFLPFSFPLPHPSPRNTLWLQRHPWFELEVLPKLRHCIQEALK